MRYSQSLDIGLVYRMLLMQFLSTCVSSRPTTLSPMRNKGRLRRSGWQLHLYVGMCGFGSSSITTLHLVLFCALFCRTFLCERRVNIFEKLSLTPFRSPLDSTAECRGAAMPSISQSQQVIKSVDDCGTHPLFGIAEVRIHTEGPSGTSSTWTKAMCRLDILPLFP